MSITRTDNSASSVLVIEPDPLMLTAMGSVLDMNGYRVVLARTETVAVDAIARGQFDVIILSMEQLQAGCDFAARLRQQASTEDTPIIFLVPQLSPAWSERLAAQGGVFSMLKPVEPHGLIDLVEKALWMPHVAGNRNAVQGSHLAAAHDWIRLSD